MLGQSPTACVQIDRRMRRLVYHSVDRMVRNRHRRAIEQTPRRWRGDRRVGRHRKHMMCAPPYTEPKDSHTSVKGIVLRHEYTKQLPVLISSTLSSTVSAQDPMDVAASTVGAFAAAGAAAKHASRTPVKFVPSPKWTVYVASAWRATTCMESP